MMIVLLFTHLLVGILIAAAITLGLAVLPAVLWVLQRIRL